MNLDDAKRLAQSWLLGEDVKDARLTTLKEALVEFGVGKISYVPQDRLEAFMARLDIPRELWIEHHLAGPHGRLPVNTLRGHL